MKTIKDESFEIQRHEDDSGARLAELRGVTRI